MRQQEEDLAKKLIAAIEDHTKSQRELTKVHSDMLNYASLTLPVLFVIAATIYCFFQLH